MIKNISIENRWIGLLVIVYLVGMFGISFPEFRSFFLPLTPLNLLLTLVVFYQLNGVFTGRFLMLSILIFLIGFFIEVGGVASGLLFGEYSYGETLGYQLFNVPVMMGVNWLFLSFASFGIVQYFTENKVLLVFIPALLMTGLDYLVEPVAISLDFWSWEGGIVPSQNYGMWFLTSLSIHLIIVLFKSKINAKISFVIFGLQVLFFGLLNCVL